MMSTKFLAVLLLALASTTASGADVRERRFISKGMGEGEVILKIGKPDHEAFNRILRGAPEEKTWTYFPALGDPQTVTIIQFHAGLVVGIERKISR